MKYSEKLFGKILLYVVLLLSSQLFGQLGGGNQSSWKSNVGILYTDPSNTFVGIGVQTPTAPLEVNAIGLKLFLNQGNNSAPSYMKFKVKSSSASWTMGLSTGNDFMIGVSDDLTDSKFTIMSSTGNIGIGTSTPASKLSVNGDIDISGSRLHVGTDGNVGIGLSSPMVKFHIKGKNGEDEILRLEEYQTGHELTFSILSGGQVQLQGVNGELPNTYTDIVLNPSGGNVGIGTTNPGTYKLAVNGSVRAKEVVVETGWSDFVFEEDYRLPPLEEVEQYIQQNGHLPGIPSAKEVAANGVSLGEMQARLLQKIEELTLYVIELKKENEVLKKRLRTLETN
ncbi:MAG: hypothetical protein D6732_22025 [Methanobacteriota archaeon]|nr:MAG: hypothetical protein D6732_22025 [Euryarchaeota archaeon]